ncbi:ectoine/hydroxyectoine ABC transporter permease subunit EhuD [Mesorhizobium australicum]|uniref:ectoine/hydroxyectoine ABC transporter permease subunit EhuD n=1 Tax=Mesorhizobium australicum TaxID=536018 RepID=UPI00333D92C4
MDWSWSFALQILPQLTEGVKLTILISLIGSALAMVLGLAVAVAKMWAGGVVAAVLSYVVAFIRGTPLLVQLYFVFYILPDAGLLLSPLAAGIITLAIHYASYTSEIFRAGIESVERGQWEAARALNFTKYQTWRNVVIPQAVPPMVPALGNYVVAMFKETPLLSTITVVELMNQARTVANIHYRYLEPMTMVGLFFLAVSIPSAFALQLLEPRYGLGRRRGGYRQVF